MGRTYQTYAELNPEPVDRRHNCPPLLSLCLIYQSLFSESEVAQSCPTLCNPMDCSLTGSSLHGILQARVLEWVAVSFSRGSSRRRDQTRVSCIPGRRFKIWATREAHSLWNLNTFFFQTPSQQRKKTSSAKSEPCSSAEKTSSEPVGIDVTGRYVTSGKVGQYKDSVSR